MAEIEELLAHDYRDGVIPVKLGTYPDTMPLLIHDAKHYGQLLFRPKSFASFMAGMFYVDALLERGYISPRLVLPFVPGARQDRLNPTGDYLFTAKSIAKEINSRNFASVTILDPHSDVISALIDRCRVIHAAELINPPAGKYAAVISPDAGAEKRAQKVARKLNVPLLHAWKSRDTKTGAISGFGLQSHSLPKNSLCLVVDDICDGGGTFIGLAAHIEAAKLRAHLWVTHGLFTQGTKTLLQSYGHVYCSDSAHGSRENVIEVQCCEKILKGEKYV